MLPLFGLIHGFGIRRGEGNAAVVAARFPLPMREDDLFFTRLILERFFAAGFGDGLDCNESGDSGFHGANLRTPEADLPRMRLGSLIPLTDPLRGGNFDFGDMVEFVFLM